MGDAILKINILEDSYGICRLEPGAELPWWAFAGDFVSITKTNEELSIVCRQNSVPDGCRCESNWKALKVEGPLDFSLTGILSSISTILAQGGISIFAVSTYDTDYILVRENDLDAAVEALRGGAYEVGFKK